VDDVWTPTVKKLPALDRWVIISKENTFFKAKRSGSKQNWIWRVDKGDRFLAQDVFFWMGVSVPDDKGKEEEERELKGQEL